MAKVCSCAFYFLQVLFTFLLFMSPAIAEESGDLMRIKTVLRDFSDKEGRPPTDVDLFSEALKRGYAMSYKDIGVLYRVVIRQNNSTLSKEDLLSIIKAKRYSIGDFQCTYVGSDTHVTDAQNSYSIECQYKMKGNLFFMDRSLRGQHGVSRNTLAYDGENIYRYIPKSSGDDNQTIAVSIQKGMDPGTFTDYRLPISNAMLMDSSKFGLSEGNWSYDLVRLLESESSMLCENKEMVNGQECVVLCNWYTRVWLSPELNFSPLRMEAYAFVEVDPIVWTTNGVV